MTGHQAALQRMEPVGQDRDYGAGVGPDQPRYQPVWLTRTTAVLNQLLISSSTQPLTSQVLMESGDIRSGACGGADLGLVLNGTALNVTLQALFAIAHIITPQRFGPYTRHDRVVRELFSQLHKGDVEYIT